MLGWRERRVRFKVCGMNQLPPGYVTQQTDAEHLKLLSIFHYVLGGLTGVFAFIPLIYVVLGIMVLGGNIPMGPGGAPGGPGGPDPTVVMGGMFIFMGVVGTVLIGAFATIQLLAARWIAQRRRWTFCFVVACIECMNAPLGTALGVFTIIVLNRPSVRAVFR